MVDSEHFKSEQSGVSNPCRQLTWPQLCGVSRVSGHAAKVFFFSLIFSQCISEGNVVKKWFSCQLNLQKREEMKFIFIH